MSLWLVLLATESFAAGESAVGLLLGAVGIGLLFGYTLTARYSARMSLVTLLDATSAPTTLLIAGGGGLLTTMLVALALPGVLRKHTAGSDLDDTETRRVTQ